MAVKVHQGAPRIGAATWDIQYSPASTAGALFQSPLAWLPLPPMSVQKEAISQRGLAVAAAKTLNQMSHAYIGLRLITDNGNAAKAMMSTCLH